jgi:predicted  nucleic acid-binding Zn-ribbon protein
MYCSECGHRFDECNESQQACARCGCSDFTDFFYDDFDFDDSNDAEDDDLAGAFVAADLFGDSLGATENVGEKTARSRLTVMSKKTSKRAVSSKPIGNSRDGRIACYHRDNYKLKDIKAKALACFVQIGIRRDIRMCIRMMPYIADPRVKIQGYQQIYDKLDDLNRLIRQRHILDENDLATIDLSWYNFPTLSRFFVAIQKHTFVREATADELRKGCSNISMLVRGSHLGDYIPGKKSYIDADEDDVFHLVNHMTPSAIQREAGVEASDIRKEKFVIVDMAAPVTILKQQFLKLLDRQAPLKLNNLADWEDHGILPYLDLCQWEKENGTKIKPQTRADLICRNSVNGYTAKKIDETTRPYAEKLMDQDGPVIRGLKADAAEEFWETIFYVREEAPDGNAEMAEEALARWFPRTYPYNLQDLERSAEVSPEHAVATFTVIEWMKERLRLESMKERIRKQNIHDPGTGVIRAAEGMQSERPYLSPPQRDTCEDISDEFSEDQPETRDASMDKFYADIIRDMARNFALDEE